MSLSTRSTPQVFEVFLGRDRVSRNEDASDGQRDRERNGCVLGNVNEVLKNPIWAEFMGFRLRIGCRRDGLFAHDSILRLCGDGIALTAFDPPVVADQLQ